MKENLNLFTLKFRSKMVENEYQKAQGNKYTYKFVMMQVIML
jgi:hypothetical protein